MHTEGTCDSTSFIILLPWQARVIFIDYICYYIPFSPLNQLYSLRLTYFLLLVYFVTVIYTQFCSVSVICYILYKPFTIMKH